ncbi:MAG TPA: anthranilate phosphoribosyltransferase, partial [Fibrobacteres bacterium]|nr:anthranilate phosphoribosyltransferase [Fibrobacterota bacterium]
EYILNPQDLGFSLATPADLLGGDAPQNAAILRDIFNGAKGPKRDVVALNAAAALYVSGVASNLKDGVAKARQALDSGAAKATLEAWVGFSNNPS